jgi:uncharacterized SAM-binding protein YcdF (DUF218 family)
MVRRLLALLLIAWAFGFGWFAFGLPQPAGGTKADAVVVLTGGSGRIQRGLAVLDKGWSSRMFVSGVYKDVKPHEFAIEYRVETATMACCVSLGFEAFDTRSNARETARWLAREKVGSIRLVTNDWHMRRAAFEFSRMLPDSVQVIEDAVPSQPSLRTLFLEYHKLLARMLAQLWGG